MLSGICFKKYEKRIHIFKQYGLVVTPLIGIIGKQFQVFQNQRGISES